QHPFPKSGSLPTHILVTTLIPVLRAIFPAAFAAALVRSSFKTAFTRSYFWLFTIRPFWIDRWVGTYVIPFPLIGLLTGRAACRRIAAVVAGRLEPIARFTFPPIIPPGAEPCGAPPLRYKPSGVSFQFVLLFRVNSA